MHARVSFAVRCVRDWNHGQFLYDKTTSQFKQKFYYWNVAFILFN